MSRRGRGSAYAVISATSLFLRNYCFPNPFEDMSITIGGITWGGEVINWAVGIILFPISFIAVSFHYSRGEKPVLGSILYFTFYAVHTYMLMCLGKYNYSLLSIVLVAISYIIFHIIVHYVVKPFRQNSIY